MKGRLNIGVILDTCSGSPGVLFAAGSGAAVARAAAVMNHLDLHGPVTACKAWKSPSNQCAERAKCCERLRGPYTRNGPETLRSSW
jgi:hypothetical protein